MKTKRFPCKNEKHDFYPNYYATWTCMAEPRCGGGESHCRKCGWYISHCECGCCNGGDTVSHRRARTILRKWESRIAERLKAGHEQIDRLEKERVA